MIAGQGCVALAVAVWRASTTYLGQRSGARGAGTRHTRRGWEHSLTVHSSCSCSACHAPYIRQQRIQQTCKYGSACSAHGYCFGSFWYFFVIVCIFCMINTKNENKKQPLAHGDCMSVCNDAPVCSRPDAGVRGQQCGPPRYPTWPVRG